MPRSPSPPYRPRGNYDPRRDRDRDWERDRDRDTDRERDRGTSTYRGRHYDPDYRGRGRGRGFRGRGRGGGGYRDERRRSYSRSLSRSRSRSRDRDRDRDRRPVDTRDRDRDRGRQYSPTKSSRSLSPEEGQITSVPSTRRRSPLPPPPRRGSPNWRRDRSTDRDRDRDRDYRDDRRDTRRPYSRSSRSPLPPLRDRDRDRDRERDYSPASASSRSLSTRFPSPEKRRVGYSPRPRSPERSPVKTAAPDPPKRPVPVAVPLHALRVPPSGPRSERFPPTGPAIPSGPRALQHHNPIQHQPPSAPQPANIFTSRPSTSGSAVESGPATPNRPSWAERRTSGFAHGFNDVKQETANVDVKIEQDHPVVDEAELEELRAREEDARIMAELPELKVPFARAKWENEVSTSLHESLDSWDPRAVADESSTIITSACWYYSIIPIGRGVCSV